MDQIPRTQNLVFRHVRAFPCVKVCVYDIRAFVYSDPVCIHYSVYNEPAYIRDLVYSEPAYVHDLVYSEPGYVHDLVCSEPTYVLFFLYSL